MTSDDITNDNDGAIAALRHGTHPPELDIARDKYPRGKYFPKRDRYKPEAWGKKGMFTFASHQKEILAQWQDSVMAFEGFCYQIVAARDDLSAIEFKKLLDELGLDKTTLSGLMQIGGDGRLGWASQHLPFDFSIWYRLTGLNDQQFEEGIDKGIIGPGSTREDLENWLAKESASVPPKGTLPETMEIHHQATTTYFDELDPARQE